MSTPQCVAVALSDGLGNQMFQYAAARAISLRADLRLKLDLGIFQSGDGFRRYMLSPFLPNAEFLTNEERTALIGPHSTATTQWWPYRVLDSLRPLHRRRLIIQTGWHFHDHLLKVRTPCLLRGHWQSEKYFYDFTELIRREFSYLEQNPLTNTKLQHEISNSNSAAIHVRRTDYLAAHTAGIHGVCPLDYYERAVREIEKRFGKVRWWIFSDDSSWVQEQPFFRSLGHILSGDPNNPLEDFQLMRSCQHFVIANSTFSWWAAWLGEKTNSLVIAPQRWFTTPNRDSSQIIPTRWLLL